MRNSPALGRHALVSSQNCYSMVFGVMRMISRQIRWQRPLPIALQVVRTSFGFHLRECMGSSPPLPPPPLVSGNPLLMHSKVKYLRGILHSLESSPVSNRIVFESVFE